MWSPSAKARPRPSRSSGALARRRQRARAELSRGRGVARGPSELAGSGKLFAWEARERDGGGLGVRVDRDEKQLILESSGETYFSSPHYEGWPGIQIHLELVDRDELRERLEEAWLIQAPKRLGAAYRSEKA